MATPPTYTLVLLKPDCLNRGLLGTVRQECIETLGDPLCEHRFEGDPQLRTMFEQHYACHKGKPFYDRLIETMAQGPVQAMVFVGDEAIIQTGRVLVNSIRAKYALANPNNTIHASDSVAAGLLETSVWCPHVMSPQLTAALLLEKQVDVQVDAQVTAFQTSFKESGGKLY